MIPDGSYFCDACVKERESNEILTCELCNHHHGALKATTKKGEYVHLVCALFSREADIQDLVAMDRVDISKVPV